MEILDAVLSSDQGAIFVWRTHNGARRDRWSVFLVAPPTAASQSMSDGATLARHGKEYRCARESLGLEVARLAVRAHGARMELESQPGNGTVARLLLPVGISHVESNFDA
jgi:hypothetical protein